MKGFPRTCSGLLCDAAATIWFHGPWCAKCGLKRWGKHTIALEARLGELRHALEEVAPLGAAPGSDLPKSFPSSGRASTSASVAVSEPAPPSVTEDELLDTLATHGLLDPIDLEWELVQRLEGVE